MKKQGLLLFTALILPFVLISCISSDDREEREFEKLLESAKPDGQEPYEMLYSLDTYPSSGKKNTMRM